MPRRIELADVADGITGHVIRDTPWDKVWPLGGIARAVRDGAGSEYRFDLMTGEVEPATRELASLARGLVSDLTRHLEARRIGVDWVRSARLTVTVDSSEQASRAKPVVCRVVIADDLGREHTSTRRGMMAPVAGATPLDRLRELLRRH